MEKLLFSEKKVETTYLIRIEREKTDTGEEIITYICGNCKDKNNLEIINKELGQYKCLNCNANNYIKQ